MEPPETRFAEIGEDRIAYQIAGEGPPDILYTSGSGSHVDVSFEYPRFQYMVRRFSSFGRLIRIDRRGVGASDPLPPDALPSWENWVDDFKAVLDATRTAKVSIVALLDAAPAALLFAATYPERTSSLVLFNSTARLLADHDYPGLTPENLAAIQKRATEEWGTEAFASISAPSLADDRAFTRWYAKLMRASSSPRAVAAHLREFTELDARRVLPSVQAPALVMHSSENALIPLAQGRYLADHLANATFIELPGADAILFGADMELILGRIEAFLTGTSHRSDPERVLSTILFTDIVGSTARLAELGDKVWRHTLETHDAEIASSVAAFQGRVAKTTGDGVLALFDGPGRALQCAFTLRDRLLEMGIRIRAGLHSGELEIGPNNQVEGMAVHIGARLVDKAEDQEVLVSRTVKDLVTGGAFSFRPRGRHQLKGVPDEWELFSALEGRAIP